jgi:methionine biosynthesis protein MetW
MEEYIKKYEAVWKGKKELDVFSKYERNRVLPLFFIPLYTLSYRKVLDVGCGDGSVSEFLEKNGFDVTSLDISQNAIEKAKYERGLKKCIVGNAEQLPFSNETFDIVFLGDVIEHLFNPQKAIMEANRVLKKEGRIIVSFPNMSYWKCRIYYLLYGMIRKTEGSQNEPWEWEHIRFFNRKIMRALLRKCGFVVEKVVGVNRSRIEDILARKIDLFASILVMSGRKL